MSVSDLKQLARTHNYAGHRVRGLAPADALARARHDSGTPGAKVSGAYWPRPFNPPRSSPSFRERDAEGNVKCHADLLWFLERDGDNGFHMVDYADKLVGLRHKGWYCDEFRDAVFRGVVYRFRAPRRCADVDRNGGDGEKTRWVYVGGYADPWNDGAALLNLTDQFTDPAEAARSADGFAERKAEAEREYQEAERERIEAEEREAGLRAEAEYSELHD